MVFQKAFALCFFLCSMPIFSQHRSVIVRVQGGFAYKACEPFIVDSYTTIAEIKKLLSTKKLDASEIYTRDEELLSDEKRVGDLAGGDDSIDLMIPWTLSGEISSTTRHLFKTISRCCAKTKKT